VVDVGLLLHQVPYGQVVRTFGLALATLATVQNPIKDLGQGIAEQALRSAIDDYLAKKKGK